MNNLERKKLLIDVFAPKLDEKILIIIDQPHDQIKSNPKWEARHQMAEEWKSTFAEINIEQNLNLQIDLISFPATGINNGPIPEDITNTAKQYNIIIAMTEFSATARLKPLADAPDSPIRVASMPGVEKRMEESALKADYQKVKKYALNLKKLLENSVTAHIVFSTGDVLDIDLRNRNAIADKGEFTQPGHSGNFPAGEAYKVPYEAIGDETEIFGQSLTKGILPFQYDNELVKFKIENNQITEIIGSGQKTEELKKYFDEKSCRRNIAELGIGCNPSAEVTGNILEDEKAGLHIAYGASAHFGGNNACDVHEDLVYAKGNPIEAEKLILKSKDNQACNLIKNHQIDYDYIDNLS